ncbi:vacuolar endopolyphosphatase [Cordyceps javanica]|uniref:Endopolyphosphatase n=1 Tax=Cordyceps javanica TaxID=43265 RepID=A0A545V242_9HYPO|nr:vacuolar endopolyphosphatase [Cordyceps javanica]TQW07010.1 vacuolar endopolyphosphatase [Cordyceps javanica]
MLSTVQLPMLLALAASVLAAPGLKVFDIEKGTVAPSDAPRKLTGRFLHITDFHPDQFYKFHADIDKSCHSGKGLAGTFGAEVSDCDSPISLANHTLDWVRDNLRDQIDFVIWTGDTARHDNDENHPRNSEQVLGTNRIVAAKMFETFATDTPLGPSLELPIVPTFGNNDFLPHNIMVPGPNRWFVDYAEIWGPFIPEEQRHQFEYGGWFYTEVIPNKLVVFSLNTMFFFDRNAAVDGCALISEPGYKHMEWLRVQFQRLRASGMKAILMGHVPPARTNNKQNWDETCWQRYTLWLKQYRDVVIGSLFGHMNIDHFVLQDTNDIDEDSILARGETNFRQSMDLGNDKSVGISGKTDYLQDIRQQWSKLPTSAGKATDNDVESSEEDSDEEVEEDDDEYDIENLFGNKKGKGKKKKGGKKKKKRKGLKKIGGKYAERYQISMIGPSVIPNYFPTMRVYEYNITGIEDNPVWKDVHGTPSTIQGMELQRPQEDGFVTQELKRRSRDEPAMTESEFEALFPDLFEDDDAVHDDGKKKKKKKKKKRKGPGPPSLVVPPGPDESSLPGPAYMPQTLSWLAFTQYYANLTRINNEAEHKGDHPVNPMKFEVEYDTRDDDWYQLADLTVREMLKLAHSIGVDDDNFATAEDAMDMEEDEESCGDDNDEDDEEEVGDVDAWGKKKKKKGKKGKKGKKKKGKKNKLWIEFLRRAFVGTMDDDDLEDF